MRNAAALALLGAATAAAAPAIAGAAAPAPAKPAAQGARAAAGAAARVRMEFAAMLPARVDVVAGESVRWLNVSARPHTATADDGSFGSPRLLAGEQFARRFGRRGEHPYHCTLHPSMRGVVGVHDVLLERPLEAAAPHRPYPLTGRSALPPGTRVLVEADAGAGFAPVATGAVGAGGRFSVRVTPTATARYRAVAAAAAGPPVRLAAIARRVGLVARRSAGGWRLRATVRPRARAGRLVLELRRRGAWRALRRARLDARSGASFGVRGSRALQARVRLTLSDGSATLATSRPVRLRAARRR